MQMNDSQRIPASKDKVWAALNNPDVLKQCIPGCQSLEMTSPTEMTATVVFKVGPVKATFGGKVTLSDLDPPNGYRISGEGSGGMAGFATGGATIRLEAEGSDVTILHYEVDAQIGGKLAQLGSRLIDSTAKKLAGEFFEKFAAVVSETGDSAAAGSAGKIAGAASVAVLALMLGTNWCCVTGHHHDADALFVSSICSSRSCSANWWSDSGIRIPLRQVPYRRSPA